MGPSRPEMGPPEFDGALPGLMLAHPGPTDINTVPAGIACIKNYLTLIKVRRHSIHIGASPTPPMLIRHFAKPFVKVHNCIVQCAVYEKTTDAVRKKNVHAFRAMQLLLSLRNE